jgi:5-methyltetrahydropteroyltriglutamate--homocysteine methyltransferase
MQIRDNEVLLPTSTVGAYPRPHWIQGRTFGSLRTPLYTSHAQRVAFEDATTLCVRDQEIADLDILTEGHTYFEWEAPGFQLEPIFHYITEMLEGCEPYGPPGEGEKYKPFYKSIISGEITWKRSLFEGVVAAMQRATDRPFKVSFLGPAQQSVIVDDRYYNDPLKLAMGFAVALNKELLYLQDMGLEAVQLIDVLPPYTQDEWQIEVQQQLFDGIHMTKLWHICYGSVDSQTDVWENKAAEMMPLFHKSPADLIHLETCTRNYVELPAFKEFPADKVLGIGVINAKNAQIETPEQVAAGIRKGLEIVPANRLAVMTDCGLGYFSRTVAFAKLKAMRDGARIVRAEL